MEEFLKTNWSCWFFWTLLLRLRNTLAFRQMKSRWFIDAWNVVLSTLDAFLDVSTGLSSFIYSRLCEKFWQYHPHGPFCCLMGISVEWWNVLWLLFHFIVLMSSFLYVEVAALCFHLSPWRSALLTRPQCACPTFTYNNWSPLPWLPLKDLLNVLPYGFCTRDVRFVNESFFRVGSQTNRSERFAHESDWISPSG